MKIIIYRNPMSNTAQSHLKFLANKKENKNKNKQTKMFLTSGLFTLKFLKPPNNLFIRPRN